MGILVVIGGSDYSGKATQSEQLQKNLTTAGFRTWQSSFPRYDTPTGKIVGGPLLGKPHIGPGFFPEGAGKVPPKVAAMYYVADRMYNIAEIKQALEDHDVVILDRYSESNMAHQAGKLPTAAAREAMFEWLEHLEYDMCELPRPDVGIVLHIPRESIDALRKNRAEKADEVERDREYLDNSTAAYLEMAKRFDYHVINCADQQGALRSIDDIAQEVFELVRGQIQPAA
jgi:dTMP kinase